MADTLLRLLEQYGYVFVAFLVMLEGFGVPVPGETALVTAAAFAAQGRLAIAGVIAASSIGSILGGTGGYWIGRTGGLSLLQRHGRWIRIDAEKLHRAQGYFDRHGALTVFVGRFVAILRILAAVLAGVARMPFPLFTVYNALGGACWSIVFGALGYAFGRNLPRLEHILGRASLVIAVVLVLGLALFLVGRRRGWSGAGLRNGVRAGWQRLVGSTRMQRLTENSPRLTQFLRSRFTPGEYLGLHLTVGLLLSVLSVVVIALLSSEVARKDASLTRLDLSLAARLHEHATPVGIALWTTISAFGSIPAMSAIGVGVSLILMLRGQRLPAVGWVVGLAGGGLLDTLIKKLVHRPRPEWTTVYASEPTWSFPSGHALGALIGYGMIAYFIVLLVPRRWARILTVIVAIAVVCIIAYSRLYLGVHYLSDILGGLAAGALWLSACISGMEVARLREKNARPPVSDNAPIVPPVASAER
ncbi:MAG: bifunctional DedA family/phosphatase PAP2 family protein [Gemmatimonadota bacterium]|nr:bifunctional DedA family/phosphatase PAP2 family protein [Gemmatimonadota bacterium]